MKEQCPKCGNWVDGKIIDTLARKATRKAVRKGGAIATGAAIGSVIPGVGTLIGGAIGFAADVLMDDTMNDVAKSVEQSIFDETDYEFKCPKCGHQWVHDISSNSKYTCCFCLGSREDLSISKYEFASALTEAKLVVKISEAFKYYDTMPVNIQVYMDEQEVEHAKSILQSKQIPFELDGNYVDIQQNNTNQNTECTQEEKEQRKFLKCLNDYFDNETEIIADIESAKSFVEVVDKLSSSVKNEVVKSEFLYLNSLCCLFYSKQHKEDNSLYELGNSYIHSALNLLADEEYRLVDLLYQSLLFDNNKADIVANQKLISSQCPIIRDIENSLLNTEYWEAVYNDIRYDSLLSSCIELENEEKYEESLQCWELINQLSNDYYQFISAYSLFSYFYYGNDQIEINEILAFKYANQALSIYDFSDSFDSNKSAHQNWLECLSEIGCMYKDGNGTRQDYQKAWEYLSKAAQLGGYSYAFVDLAEIYEEGLGMPKNLNKAIELYRKAADIDNNEIALNKIKELCEKSTGDDSVISKEQNATDAELEYLEMLKDCLEEDGEISTRERRLLERLRMKLNISSVRAEELERQLLVCQLTDEEQEYLEEYKACRQTGEISSKERRLLEKLRIMLNISEERCKILESQIS